MASLPSQTNAVEPEEATRMGGDHTSAEHAADDCKDTPVDEDYVFKDKKDIQKKAKNDLLSPVTLVSVLMARLREGKDPYAGQDPYTPAEYPLDLSAIPWYKYESLLGPAIVPHPGPPPVPPYDDIQGALQWLARARVLNAYTAYDLYKSHLRKTDPEVLDKWKEEEEKARKELGLECLRSVFFWLGCGRYHVEYETFGILLRHMRILELCKIAGTYEEEKTVATAILEAIDAKVLLKLLVDSETISESAAQMLLGLIERVEATQADHPYHDPPLLMYRTVRAGVPEEKWWGGEYADWTVEERDVHSCYLLEEEIGVDTWCFEY
ncbi:uncharacterized protein E0L32_008815 [Thyridium curvatum]|uniref:Uncharacterized protein n=1 Tax=Thyridium curvatum TaxID=1093900 RepID=A0A507AYT4_9PEZI|nr:uncharacterized protein E0L32_008815 [Thyridium curvatum]TPX09968.1 hypothetical protein E0L32_008815 [Thyridium curvatum]